MSREKGKNTRNRKILIRVNKDEKALAEKLSKEQGLNTSEYFRDLLDKAEQAQEKIDLEKKIDKILTGVNTLLLK